jgi:hypothetical protein
LRAMLVALPILVIFFDKDSLWLSYSGIIPGAVAIRAIGRVVLLLLVPAALGLACLVQFLDQRRLAIASWIIALVCLAEQTVTTDTFDAAANRQSIQSLASQVDQSRVAFFYHPNDHLEYVRNCLDAMWATLDTGVPTVNGFSGHVPSPWWGLFTTEVDPEKSVEPALADWEKSQGLLPNHVQWIAADPAGTSRSETGQAPSADVSTPKPGSK